MRSFFRGAAKVATCVFTALSGLAISAQTINGAGASFPAPLYQQWISEYVKISGTKINYQGVGSSAGLAQIRAKTVDFGASDEPLKKENLDKDGLMQFPLIMGGIVPIVNLPDVKPGQLRLSGELLAKIFLGKTSSWNDPEIAKLNEGMKLPDLKIVVVRRADGSGTTWNFTNYLAKVSKEWAEGPGCGKEIKWMDGSVGGQTNSGVASLVKKIKGSIGYVESAYAFENNMAYTQLQNKDGKFVTPSNETFQAAAANADWKNAPGFYMVLTDQPGEKSWPIMASSYIMIYREQADAAKATIVLKFFEWAYDNGGKIAEKLNYVPMPKSVSDTIKEVWKNEVKSAGKQVYK